METLILTEYVELSVKPTFIAHHIRHRAAYFLTVKEKEWLAASPFAVIPCTMPIYCPFWSDV
jgi:hypothetical protein